MKIIKTLVKKTSFGYTNVIEFYKEGDKCCYRNIEEWEDGHITFGRDNFAGDKDYANNKYKRLLAEGYTVR